MKTRMWGMVVVAGLALSAAAVQAQVEFIGKALVHGEATDLSGLTEQGHASVPNNRWGGWGSAIAYTGQGDRYIVVADRGFGDGKVAFHCRFHEVSITIAPGEPEPVKIELLKTVLLKDESGQPLTGNTGSYNVKDPAKGLRYDPEGVRVTDRGTLLISEEYGPWIDEFDMNGTRIARIMPPQHYLMLKPDGEGKNEMPPKVDQGRAPNRGFEGLATWPQSDRIYVALQSPLIQDNAFDAKGERLGVNVRILEIDGQTTRELVYVLESPKNAISEVLALNGREMLVLERDGKGGEDARTRRVYVVDVDESTDVSNVESLPARGLPPGTTALRKRMLLDFLDPKWGLAGADMPEKIEGMAWGPDLPDGRRVLIVTTDNDFKAEQPSQVWVFAFDRSALPVFQIPWISADPERR